MLRQGDGVYPPAPGVGVGPGGDGTVEVAVGPGVGVGGSGVGVPAAPQVISQFVEETMVRTGTMLSGLQRMLTWSEPEPESHQTSFSTPRVVKSLEPLSKVVPWQITVRPVPQSRER